LAVALDAPTVPTVLGWGSAAALQICVRAAGPLKPRGRVGCLYCPCPWSVRPIGRGCPGPDLGCYQRREGATDPGPTDNNPDECFCHRHRQVDGLTGLRLAADSRQPTSLQYCAVLWRGAVDRPTGAAPYLFHDSSHLRRPGGVCVFVAQADPGLGGPHLHSGIPSADRGANAWGGYLLQAAVGSSSVRPVLGPWANPDHNTLQSHPSDGVSPSCRGCPGALGS